MIDERKFYRTTYTMAILSEEPIPSSLELPDVLRECIDGHYVEDWGTPMVVTAAELSKAEMAAALTAAGSDPGFFDCDDDEEEEEEERECDERCAVHARRCDGFCDHDSQHHNACLPEGVKD